MKFLIFDHEPAEDDLADGTVEADDHEEAAYRYTCDQSWMSDGDQITVWVQEVESGEVCQFYCTRPYRDGSYDPEVEEVEDENLV